MNVHKSACPTHLLISVGDGLGDSNVVPQGSQPELGDTSNLAILVLLVGNLGNPGTLLLVVLVIRVSGLTSFNLGVGGLSLSGDDGLPSLVKRSVLGKELSG